MAKIDCSGHTACCKAAQNEMQKLMELNGIARSDGRDLQKRLEYRYEAAKALRVYIAGPMRGIPYFNFPAFDKAARVIRDVWGMTPISPADMDREVGFDATTFPAESDWSNAGSHGLNMVETIQRDIAALCGCDAVVMLPGWRESRGARAEHAVAEWMGIRVVVWDVNDSPTFIRFADPPPTPDRDRDILDIAATITRGDRQATYGPPDQDFRRTAEMWSALKGVAFEPWEVAQFMIALKLSRETHQRKRDNAIDIAGYARCLDVCNKAAGVY